MALIWADSFEHYGLEDNGRDEMLRGPYSNMDSNTEPVTTQARTGTYSLEMDNQNGDGYEFTLPGSARLVVGVGYAVYYDGDRSEDYRQGMLFYNGSTELLAITVNQNGSISVCDDLNGTPYVTSESGVVETDQFVHIEAKVTIDDVAGACEVRVQGETVINLTGQDFGTAGVTSFFHGCTGAGLLNEYWIDDLVVWDDTGDVNNDFLGAVRVGTAYCDGDGSPSDWSVTGAANAYQAVDDTAPDDNSTYISADTIGQIQALSMPALASAAVTIYGVVIPVLAQLGTAGSGAFTTSLHRGGSPAEADVGDEHTLTASYGYFWDVYETDPSSSSPSELWDKADLEAAIFTIEKTS